tara:strand:- start:31024 stop:31638 length:615 start_codon:yes stop_codon:yes gene_type:complete
VSERKSKQEEIGFLSTPSKKLTFVGDYVYLPYSFMCMCKDVEFISHSSFLISGTSLLPIEHWTVKTITTLIGFKPQALFGGTIKDYQKESVPAFVQHIREEDPAMWELLIKERPELDINPDYVGRKAILNTLNSPIKWTSRHAKYPVSWEWDGVRITTESIDAYNCTWGDLKIDNLKLTSIPSDSTEIIVQDNSWVNSQTKFVD